MLWKGEGPWKNSSLFRFLLFPLLFLLILQNVGENFVKRNLWTVEIVTYLPSSSNLVLLPAFTCGRWPLRISLPFVVDGSKWDPFFNMGNH
jgi:hypothetical protein